MTTTNDITGQSIVSRVNSKEYEDNYDRIFGNGNKENTTETEYLLSSKNNADRLKESILQLRNGSTITLTNSNDEPFVGMVDDIFFIDGSEPDALDA